MRLCLPILASALLLWGYEGIITRFHPNGMKSEEIHFRLEPNPATGELDTVRWGEATRWREDGSLASKLNCKAGVLDGTDIGFYPTGEVAARSYYRSGKFDSSVYFQTNGKIRRKTVRWGEATKWFEDGQLV